MNPTRIRRAATIAGAATAVAAAAAVPAALAASSHSSHRRSITRRVRVVDNMFMPAKVTIHVGDRIDFVWSDQNFNTHNVTLEKAPRGVSKRAFSSIDGARMLHFEKRFTRAGTYAFRCTIHSDMTETVTVKK